MNNIKNDTLELAEYYDLISDSQYELGLILIDLMKITVGDIVLDVGCGTGRLAFHVSGLVGSAGKMIGIDPSPHRIQVASNKLKASAADNISFAMGQGETLDGFKDCTFSGVYYCAVFHWIEDQQAALKEAFRVLRPGGTVGITSRNRDHLSLSRTIARECIEKHSEAMRDYTADTHSARAHWAGQEELEALLTNAGFVNIRFESQHRTHYFKSSEEYFAFLKASAFGQSSRLPEPIRQEMARKVAEKLEKKRTPLGIELHSSSLFAIARKKA
jgi:arsenite methyltransferase